MVNIDFPVIIFRHAEVEGSISLDLNNVINSSLTDKYCVIICICV